MRRDPPAVASAVLGLGLALALAPARVAGRRPSGSLTGGGGHRTTNGAAKTADKTPSSGSTSLSACVAWHRHARPAGRRPGGSGCGSAARRRPPDPKKLDEAQKACGRLMAAATEPPDRPEERDAMVAFAAACASTGSTCPIRPANGLVMRKDDDAAPTRSGAVPGGREGLRPPPGHLGRKGSEERS
jgi:hypothetical protein